MVVALLLFLATTSIISSLSHLIGTLSFPTSKGIRLSDTALWDVITILIPTGIGFIVFFLLYLLIPKIKVKPKAAFWAALIATIAWQAVTRVYSFIVGRGLSNLNLIYGSLGAILGLIIWIYWTYLIIFFCAHLSAVIGGNGLDKIPVKPIDV